MPKAFNQRPSPKVESPRIMALQVLRRLHSVHPDTTREILAEIGISDYDLTESMEWLYQEAIDAGELTECGCCGHYHRPDYRGDCRDGDESFPNW